MARPVITKERVLVDTLQALQCDVCDFVYATEEPDARGRPSVENPEGAGQLYRANKRTLEDGTVSHSETLDLCPTCMSAVWGEVTKRREKHKGG